MGACTSKLEERPVAPAPSDKKLLKQLSSWVDPSHRKPRQRLTTSAEGELFGSIEMRVQLTEQPSTDRFALVRESVIGKDSVIWTPYGKRKLVYADYTASGRLLGFVEDYLRDVALPLYANTHTEASATGFQTTVLREEARAIVAKALNAPREEYATLFVGTGCTGAIDKLGRVLGLQVPDWARPLLDDLLPAGRRPVVFHGPYEHHSNELWWRESIADVVAIAEDATGRPDLAMLERKLIEYAERPTKIGSFSAGSNVTGICTDVSAVAELLHAHGALAFFDFAGTGAYVDIDMSPPPRASGADASMDAIFLSPHKFIGGPGSSGLLVARRSLFSRASAPTCPGGGTVSYVTPHGHDYEEAIEAREDGGTPPILQAIRCGLAFKVKEMVGCSAIEQREQALGRAALEAWSAHPALLLMGSDRTAYFDYEKRVSIISFNILLPESFPRTEATRSYAARFGGRPMLHPHFVIQLLNDVYGIQGRSGCSCTGPYGHRLFGMADTPGGSTINPLSAALRKVVLGNGENAAKPGWARVNFNYFIDDAEAKFVRDAVLQIATDGWRLLPLYQIDPRSGQFVHRSFERLDTLRSLAELQFDDDRACRYRVPCQDVTPLAHQQVLADAAAIYKNAAEAVLFGTTEGAFGAEVDYSPPASAELLECEWWCTPSAAAAQLRALGRDKGLPCSRICGQNAQQAARLVCSGSTSGTSLDTADVPEEQHVSRSSQPKGSLSEFSAERAKSLEEFEKSEMAKIMRPRG